MPFGVLLEFEHPTIFTTVPEFASASNRQIMPILYKLSWKSHS